MKIAEFAAAASFAAECVEDGNTALGRKVIKQIKHAASVHVQNPTLREGITAPAAIGQPGYVLQEAGRIKALVEAHLWQDEFCK